MTTLPTAKRSPEIKLLRYKTSSDYNQYAQQVSNDIEFLLRCDKRVERAQSNKMRHGSSMISQLINIIHKNHSL
jgi:hypothetical protein